MTQDRPTAAELVDAVREFLERDVMAATEGRVQFHTRVAVNALGMIERELDRSGPSSRRPSARAAAALLGHDGDVRDARARARGRASATARSTTGSTRCATHVRATVREKLLVANPGYLPADPSA